MNLSFLLKDLIYWSVIIGTLERARYADDLLFRQHIARYNFATGFANGKLVLDYGCGEGYGAALLSGNAKKVISLDISYEAVRQANKKLSSGVIQADVCYAPFRSGSFDMVVSFEVFEHISNVMLYLKEICRVAKDSGVFLMSTPNVDYYPMAGLNPYHIKEYSVDEVTKFLTDAGFRDIKIFAQVPKRMQIARLERSKFLLFLMKAKRKVCFHGELLPRFLQRIVNRIIAGGPIDKSALEDYQFIEGKNDESVLLYFVRK